MKIVVLTNNGSLYGKKILNAFLSAGIKIYAVIIIKQPVKYYLNLFKNVREKVGFFDTVYFSIKRVLAPWLALDCELAGKIDFIRSYNEMKIPLFYTKATNSEEFLKIVREIAPDLLILGQTGIAGSGILGIPAIGCLNAHPGILPDYRGIDCAKWAIYNQEFDKVGASVHWVDKGVDTGNIIAKEKYNFCGSETVGILDMNLDKLCAQLLIKVISFIQNGNIPCGEPQAQKAGKQYYKMPRKKEIIARNHLRGFLKNRELPGV